ncbi:MAG: Uma2 family endonuclease [Cyanobacteria bacterium J06638_28]
MTFATGYSVPQTDPPRSPRETLPTMYDLPSEQVGEPGLPDEFHDLQPQLLSRSLALVDYTREEWFTGADLNLYYDNQHPSWYKRPDWFLAVGVPRLYDGHDMRRSYVTWQERQAPHVVIEFLSPGTQAEDLGRFWVSPQAEDEPAIAPERSGNLSIPPETVDHPPGKLAVYEHYLRVPHYVVYNRQNSQLRYFQITGSQYQEQVLNAQTPQLWLADLQVGLGIWQGQFEGMPGHWLRWYDREGNWLLTDTEQERQAKEIERQAKEAERQAKEAAQAQILQSARNLLGTGMSLEQVTDLLNLTTEQVTQLLD